MIVLPNDVKYILQRLQEFNKEGYIVGGCVRDSLLDKKPQDWDICTSALPEEVRDIFASRTYVIPTGLKHGTVTIMLNHNHYEVTTFRQEGKYSNNRHPDTVVYTTDINKDLSRRDFTINAMAMGLSGQLIDPFDGQKDLGNRLIKTVGDPRERFNEDALRMLRAIRFSAQLDFTIAPKTLAAIKYNAHLLENISKERIRDELIKILESPQPSDAFYLLYATELLEIFLPELAKGYGFSQRTPHHHLDIFEHTLNVVDKTPNRLKLRLGALLHDIGKPATFTIDESGLGHFYRHNVVGEEIAGKILSRLRFPKEIKRDIKILVREHMNVFINNWTEKTLKKFINRVGKDNVPDLLALHLADMEASASPTDYQRFSALKDALEEVLNKKEPLTVKDLAISGRDLIDMGFEPGPRIGQTLNFLLEQVLEDASLNTKEKLLSIVRDNS